MVLPRFPYSGSSALRSPRLVLHHTSFLRGRLRIALYQVFRDGAHDFSGSTPTPGKPFLFNLKFVDFYLCPFLFNIICDLMINILDIN